MARAGHAVSPGRGVTWNAPSIAVVGSAAALAALSAAVASQRPLLFLSTLVGLALVVSVCLHPPVAAYVLLGSTPLIVGMERGLVVPVLRPSEVVLGVVAFAVALRAGGEIARGARDRVLQLNRLDAAIVFFAVSGSIIPLLWLVARGKHVEQEDVLWGLQLWKYYAVFLIVRFSVRTERQVRNCLWVTMFAMAIVSAVAILQSLELFGVPSLLREYWGADADISDERGRSTIASSLAVGSVMVVSLAISATWLLRGHPRKHLLLGLSVMFLLGVIAAGQFSGYIAFVVASVVVGYMTGSLGRYIAALVPAVAVGAVALWPVIQTRLAGFQEEYGLPHSWVGRLENLKTYFWPQLGDFNWVLGVRPAGRLPAPEKWRDWIYIESGETWLLWTGGVLFFAAFWIFMWVAIRRVVAVARQRVDAIGTAAVACLTSLVVIIVLMTFDPHITLRGEAELLYSLLALSMVGFTGDIRPRRSGVLNRRRRRAEALNSQAL